MSGFWSDYPDYEPSRPLPAEGGIAARSRRGDIGETWWSRRFIELLESFGVGSRLKRGRNYARTGQVLELDVEPGVVLAKVQGSRYTPYRVRIRGKLLSENQWRRAEKAMASQALPLARLLAGEMPTEIEDVFAACRLTLFPELQGRAEGQLHVPGLGEPVQARRCGVLHPRRALRRGSVPDLRVAGTRQGGIARAAACAARGRDRPSCAGRALAGATVATRPRTATVGGARFVLAQRPGAGRSPCQPARRRGTGCAASSARSGAGGCRRTESHRPAAARLRTARRGRGAAGAGGVGDPPARTHSRLDQSTTRGPRSPR